MNGFEYLHIPKAHLDSLPETEKLKLISHNLGAVGLDACSLLYCGVEGKPLLDGVAQNARFTTFAASYRKIEMAAQDIDTEGSTAELGYPLDYAHKEGVEVPAILVYDRTLLVPVYPEDDEDWDWQEEWTHRDKGSSIDEARRAAVFFDE